MSSTMTVRDHIESIRREVRDTDLLPDRAAELLNQLSALLGNVLDEIRDADMDYAVVLLKHLDSEEAANRAKIRAQTTPEYLRSREARDTKEIVVGIKARNLVENLAFMLEQIKARNIADID